MFVCYTFFWRFFYEGGVEGIECVYVLYYSHFLFCHRSLIFIEYNFPRLLHEKNISLRLDLRKVSPELFVQTNILGQTIIFCLFRKIIKRCIHKLEFNLPQIIIIKKCVKKVID